MNNHNSDIATRSILILGGPASGKTVFGGQLLGRLNEGISQLRMHGTPENIDPFQDVLFSLNEGLAATHTAASVYHEVVLPLQASDGNLVNLVWPDYGGEQIKAIIHDRKVPQEWWDRLERASGWLLFVRASHMLPQEHILSRPISTPETSQASVDGRETMEGGHSNKVNDASDSPDAGKWSEQAALVELLQILLFLKGKGTMMRVKAPALLVVLSCWDELGEQDSDTLPGDLLQRGLPLLSDFMRTTWRDSSYAVLGLSSQEKTLDASKPDSQYRELGPERFGYCVMPDGNKTNDLTQPIRSLMTLMS